MHVVAGLFNETGRDEPKKIHSLFSPSCIAGAALSTFFLLLVYHQGFFDSAVQLMTAGLGNDALSDGDAFCVKAEERLKGNVSSILLKNKKNLYFLSLSLSLKLFDRF